MSRKWENAYLNTKNPKASGVLEHAPDPRPQWGSLRYVGKFHGSGPGAPPDQILDPHLCGLHFFSQGSQQSSQTITFISDEKKDIILLYTKKSAKPNNYGLINSDLSFSCQGDCWF